MRYQNKHSGGFLAAVAVTLIVAFGWIAVTTASADVPRKLQRQIEIMEEAVSEMLIDSPNWLVSHGGPAYGVYLDAYGAVFGFDASLVSSGRHGIHIGDFSIRRLFSRDHVVIYDDDDWDDEDWDDDDEAYKKWRSKRKARDARRYERGKDEMRELLLDFGATIDVADNEWVALVACLENDKFFRRNKLHRFVIKAKGKDLKQYDDGKLSLEEAEKRLVEEEY